ncbi:MAG TPA: LCP family protein [Candidatus Saccharimonadales bacterium]|nr:LCP family protein [Candidatus Saccharimonadales bacterium]
MPPNKPQRIPPFNGSARPRPGQDIIVAKKHAKNFPGVGMTLPTYQSAAPGRARLAAQRPVKRGRMRGLFARKRIKRAIIIIVILIALTGLFVLGKFLYNAHKLFGGSIFGAFKTTHLRGEDRGRVNILLAGNSADDPGHEGGTLTDSIMIVSLDTRNHTAFLMSIPRDLWVDIPGGGHQKINAAYSVGQADNFSQAGYPKGGMGLLEKVVESNFDVPIDYYALVNYSALRDSVNAVGGINFTVHSDDPRGLYDPSIDYKTNGPLVNLSNGTHKLNGEQARDLARARGDAYGAYGFGESDFQRTQDQRELLISLKNKAFTPGVIANPAKLTSLFDAVGSNVKTDFKLPEVRRLYDLTKQVNSKNIKSLSLNDANGKNLLTSYTTADGESALIPAAGMDDFGDIQAFLHQQTSSNPVVREDASIVVLNAAGVDGLASQERTQLKVKDLNITGIGDAQADQATTTIIDASGGKKPSTKKYLGQLYGNHFTATNPYTNLYPDADFIILLGSDQASHAASN